MWQIFIELFLCQTLFFALNKMDKNPWPFEVYILWGEGIENKQDKV